MLGNDAKGLAARVHRRARDRAHDAHIARPVDQPPAVRGKRPAQLGRRRLVGRAGAGTRSTEDADGSYNFV